MPVAGSSIEPSCQQDTSGALAGLKYKKRLIILLEPFRVSFVLNHSKIPNIYKALIQLEMCFELLRCRHSWDIDRVVVQ